MSSQSFFQDMHKQAKHKAQNDHINRTTRIENELWAQRSRDQVKADVNIGMKKVYLGTLNSVEDCHFISDRGRGYEKTYEVKPDGKCDVYWQYREYYGDGGGMCSIV